MTMETKRGGNKRWGVIGRDLVQNEKGGGKKRMKKEAQKRKASKEKEQRRSSMAKAQNHINDCFVREITTN